MTVKIGKGYFRAALEHTERPILKTIILSHFLSETKTSLIKISFSFIELKFHNDNKKKFYLHLI